jgi:hypothetical protein
MQEAVQALLLSDAHPDEFMQAAVGCILHYDVQLLILVCKLHKAAAMAVSAEQQQVR